MNSHGLNFNLTFFKCLIEVTMLELLGMLRRSHYSGISTFSILGYKYDKILVTINKYQLARTDTMEKFM